jgi:hypothetical protein
MGKKLSSPKREQSQKRGQPASIGDIAVVWGRNENGIYILRRRAEEGPLEAGLLQPLVEGRPINGEVISMQRRHDLPYLFDVKTEVAAPQPSEPVEPSSTSQGPSQVATESYRKGWDAIWGPDSGSARRNLN